VVRRENAALTHLHTGFTWQNRRLPPEVEPRKTTSASSENAANRTRLTREDTTCPSFSSQDETDPGTGRASGWGPRGGPPMETRRSDPFFLRRPPARIICSRRQTQIKHECVNTRSCQRAVRSDRSSVQRRWCRRTETREDRLKPRPHTHTQEGESTDRRRPGAARWTLA